VRAALSIRPRLPLALAAIGVALLGACKSIEGDSPVLIPNLALELSRSVSIPADVIALGAGLFLVVDPLAPNWRVEQQDIGNGRYAIAMTKKRFATGGDGESRHVLRRRAEQIGRERGFSSYEVIEFNEGIESNVIAQRVSRAVVQFAR
jgi:hypothetical protein